MAKPATIPSEDALLKAMEVCKSSAEGAQYFNSQMIAIVNRAKMNESAAELLVPIKTFTEQIEMQFNTQAQVWSGEEAQTTLFNAMHAKIADSAAQTLATIQNNAEEKPELNFNFAIDILFEIFSVHNEINQFLNL